MPKRYTQGPWPPRTDDQPVGFFQVPDATFRSDRSLAGPLRTGTEPRVGPRGLSAGGESRSSDMGMDRVSPRGFDPEGTALSRYGPQFPSPLIAREVRRRR